MLSPCRNSDSNSQSTILAATRISMEDDMLKGSMVSGSSTYGDLDLQGSAQINHHRHQQGFQHRNQSWLGTMQQHSMHDVFPLTMGRMQDGDQSNTMADFNKMDGGKHSASDEEELTFNEEGVDGQHETDKGRKLPVWHRVKWTDSMVVLLITAVSYMGEDTASECGGAGVRRKFANLQKKGKWKTVSKVMAQRGLCVSPQQCEDKFNDLNKRYKKLNEILGRGTCCQVVENPALLNMMDHLSDKTKDEVRKILSSKQLFYEEMCSYHNGNRLHLPPDPALQRSLQMALCSRDDLDEDDHDVETDEHEECEEIHHRDSNRLSGDPAKKMKQGLGPENSQQFDKGFRLQPQNQRGDMHPPISEGSKAGWLQEQSLKSRVAQLEEQKLQIDIERLELEKQQFKWRKFSRKKDRELEKQKMENERMRLENEQMALELRQMEMSINTR